MAKEAAKEKGEDIEDLDDEEEIIRKIENLTEEEVSTEDILFAIVYRVNQQGTIDLQTVRDILQGFGEEKLIEHAQDLLEAEEASEEDLPNDPEVDELLKLVEDDDD